MLIKWRWVNLKHR